MLPLADELLDRIQRTPVTECTVPCLLLLSCRQHPESGGVGIEVEYDDGMKVFTPEQIVACMLTKVCRWRRGFTFA